MALRHTTRWPIAREHLTRIREGIDLLGSNPHAAEAFRFANRAMWRQRIHTLYALEARRGHTPEMAQIDLPRNRSWYPFQLAFILLNLPGLTDSTTRTGAARARPWPTCSGSPPAAARPKPTWACRPTRWACGGCKAPWPGARARTAWPC